MKEEKKKLLKIKTLDDFYDFDAEVCKRMRDEYYTKALEDMDVRDHIKKLFGVSDDAIDNALFINDAPPLDDFPEDET